MIKNLVFDMGKVLVDYDSYQVCRQFMTDWQMMERVNTTVFISPEWIMLDMGILSETEALLKMQSRLKTDEERQMAALCLAHWHEYCMSPKAGMGELLAELKSSGYGLYLCSNAPIRLLECYQQVIPGIELFDGILFSAQVKCIKPQREIYQHLFQQFSLKAEECYFVDDLLLNIDGAKACGMDGYCFIDGNVELLRKKIHSLNQ